jgi:hypothetical protein
VTTCVMCRFWMAQSPVLGLCRRMPPTPIRLPTIPDVHKEDIVSVFPSMMADGWCGEHRPIVNGG